MGSALIRGMISSGIASCEKITLTTNDPKTAHDTAALLGCHSAASNPEALADADVAFLCVKPGQSLEVVAESASRLQGKLLISIVAGIHAADLFQAAGGKARVIRAMPNTAVRLRKAVTAIAPDASASGEDISLTMKIFSSVGTALEVREKDLDTVTAVSGSGPAFALLILEALAQGGIEGGLDPDVAKACAAGALAAAAALVTETGETPLALRQEITSPGGTTAAGLEVLTECEIPSMIRRAVDAARKRSIELSATR